MTNVLDRVRSRLQRPAPTGRGGAGTTHLEALTGRVQQLELVVEGLQDALYRQANVNSERFLMLERKTEPEALAKALSDDARRRGL